MVKPGCRFVQQQPAEESHRCIRFDLVEPLHCGELEGLVLHDPSRREILADHLQQRLHGREDEPNFHRGAGELSVPSKQHIVGADADNQESAGHPGAQHDMDEPIPRTKELKTISQ